MATQWPVVHARLVALLPTLTGWGQVKVTDGPAVTGDAPTDFATVGFALAEDSAGTLDLERAGNGFQVEETGSVRCELVVWVGDASLAAVRSRAFALLDALEVEVRRDQTLGVLPPASTSRLVVDVVPQQTTAGAAQRLAFSVEYFCRT